MILVAVSGGPDSMFLLYKYRNKKIVVAHVNYHLRSNSNLDESIVRKFCQNYKIPLEVLNVTSKPQGNIQNWARNVRYDFFIKVAKKYRIKKLLTAHHKDDFLETALMQYRSKREPKYFGIKQKNKIFDLTIYRPLLHKFTKREIERFLHQHHIEYSIDESNLKMIYTRNKIRAELLKTAPSEKRQYYQWFLMSNKILEKKTRKVNALFKKWETLSFDTLFFKTQKRFKVELVFELVHKYFKNVKLSKSKMENLIQFIESQKNSQSFQLSHNQFLEKIKFHLIVNKTIDRENKN